MTRHGKAFEGAHAEETRGRPCAGPMFGNHDLFVRKVPHAHAKGFDDLNRIAKVKGVSHM
jgi:hypothetical protein